MQKIIMITLASALLLGACENETISSTVPDPQTTTATYNPELAKELGADDYGMSQYVFVTLLTGPNDATITDEAQRAELFKGHFDMIGRLAEDRKLVLAGPFMEASPKRGLYIFDVTTIEEAKELVKTDPSIAAGIFKVEFDKYYGSAALKQINDIHKTIAKKDI